MKKNLPTYYGFPDNLWAKPPHRLTRCPLSALLAGVCWAVARPLGTGLPFWQPYQPALSLLIGQATLSVTARDRAAPPVTRQREDCHPPPVTPTA